MASRNPRVDACAARAAEFARPPRRHLRGKVNTAGIEAGRHFRGTGPGARRACLGWFDEAKTAPPRGRRMAKAIARLAEGRRRHGNDLR